MNEASRDEARDGARATEQPPLSVHVTWTPAALDALKALEASGLSAGLDAAGIKRKWNAALKKAARECVAQVRPRGAAEKWAKQHREATWSMDATFVCDAEMRELNARFRAKDRPTDVLSFSQAESAPINTGPLDSELESNSELEAEEPPLEIEWPGASGSGGEAVLGDLVVAVETAQRQANERAHAGEVEVLFLAIHGALHLLGYDHQTSSQRVAMWREQEALFERLRVGVEAGGRRR